MTDQTPSGGVGPLHEAASRALCDAMSGVPGGPVDERDRTGAAAVLRVVGTYLTREIEALPGYGRGDNGESLPDGHLLPRADVLAVVVALLEHPDA